MDQHTAQFFRPDGSIDFDRARARGRQMRGEAAAAGLGALARRFRRARF